MIESIVQLNCPVAVSDGECVSLAHGEGGRLMRKLLREHVTTRLGMPQVWDDAAALKLSSLDIAVTTDSFVVSPLFFPGGDIGSLSVYGTVNDLAVSGARPIALTLAMILEEGLPIADLVRIVDSVYGAALRCGVSIVAGDTKVVPCGAADKVFLNTTGFGVMRPGPRLCLANIRTGDRIIVSGPIGRHGIAVMASRENLGLTPAPTSDSAPLHEACQALHAALGADLRSMRDATRGGVSAVLHEWSEATATSIKLIEANLPVSPDVRGACELLGLDPLYVANEGTFVAAVARDSAPRALAVLQSLEVTSGARLIGEVIPQLGAPVVIERLLGSLHPVDEPAGAPLPRIC